MRQLFQQKGILYDATGLIYRRQKYDKHQLLVARTLIKDMIRENHDPVYADQPGLKRTCELLPLSSLGPGMRKSVDFVKEFDSCQRRKRHHEFNAPLGNIGNPVAYFCDKLNGYYWAVPINGEKKLSVDVCTSFFKICGNISRPGSICFDMCENLRLANSYSSWQRFKIDHRSGRRLHVFIL